jgi:hypothetical protein
VSVCDGRNRQIVSDERVAAARAWLDDSDGDDWLNMGEVHVEALLDLIQGSSGPIYECGTETPGVCAWNPSCMVAGCAGREGSGDA